MFWGLGCICIWRGSRVLEVCLDDERIYFLLSCRHKGPFECRTELLAGPCIFMENPDRGGSCSDTGVGETGVSEVQGGRACRSVSRFQTSEFFWLKSLIRFIMHIPALIKVIGVWHSQCQSREPGNTSLPSPLSPCLFMPPLLLMHAWNV